MTDPLPHRPIARPGEVSDRPDSPIPQDADVLLLVEEGLEVLKRKVVTGKVRVSTRTETREETTEVILDRAVVDVTRVPVGRMVEVAPAVRTEDDTVIVPVLEERFVVVKQLFLKEELHIRRRIEQEVSIIPVELRRQVAVVQRVDPQGRVIDDLSFQSDPNPAEDGANQGQSHGHS